MNAARGGKCPRRWQSTLAECRGTDAAKSHFSAMAGRIATLSIALALAACSSQSDKQLIAVKSARSVIAEWALVERQAADGRAQATYVEQMRQLAKDELKTDARSLSQRPDAANLLEQLRAGSPDAQTLKSAGDALEPLEDSLEAA
jgi:hypothetical protein